MVDRRPTQTFIEPEEQEQDLRKSYCEKCERCYGMLNKLVPRFRNGVEDDDFKICSYCGDIVPKHEAMLETEYEPKATVIQNPYKSGVNVVVASERRNTRNQREDNSIEDFDIPKLAGKEDIELKSLLHNGRPSILNYINDERLEDLADY